MMYDLDWLIQLTNNGDPVDYLFFWGHTYQAGAVGKASLSQWYPAPFTVGDITYHSAEHWMMVGKARLFGDLTAYERIVMNTSPAEVKTLGRQIVGFDEARWSEVKYAIVRDGNLEKFSQNQALRDYLLSTGDKVIVEASPTDRIWGIGLTQDDPLARDPRTWRGQNLLGFALMEVRHTLRLQ